MTKTVSVVYICNRQEEGGTRLWNNSNRFDRGIAKLLGFYGFEVRFRTFDERYMKDHLASHHPGLLYCMVIGEAGERAYKEHEAAIHTAIKDASIYRYPTFERLR